MAYYIKTIGIRRQKNSIFEGRFPRMLLSQMCFKTGKGAPRRLKKGDRLVLYCVIGGAKEFPKGGFIGTQRVLGKLRKNEDLFEKEWRNAVAIQPEIYSFRDLVTLQKVRGWKAKSRKLDTALRGNLQAIGGLWEIDRADYRQFLSAFKAHSQTPHAHYFII